MSPVAKLEELAFEAGKAGLSYSEFSSSDEVFDLVSAADSESGAGRVDFRSVEEAYRRGRREGRVATWKTAWTTAPVDYDQFGTETIEECGEHHGKKLWKVLIDPRYADYQEGRYGSGLHGSWEEDPREQEQRWAEERARERSEAEEREARRKAGLEWLRVVDEALLQRALDEDDEELRGRCLRWEDARDELRRREKEREAITRAEKWARCRATFEDGATLVDEGAPSSSAFIGSTPYRIPGRDPKLWHSVIVVLHYAVADDADQARVVVRVWGKYAAKDYEVGSLACVAERIEKGELRVARPDEQFPPRAALERIGCDSWKDVLRVESGGKVAWVGVPRFGWDPLVVDDAGKLVRVRALREAGEKAWRAKRYGG